MTNHVSGGELGRMALEVAQGTEQKRELSREQTSSLRQSIATKVTPKIEEIRKEQRRAFEDAKMVLLK